MRLRSNFAKFLFATPGEAFPCELSVSGFRFYTILRRFEAWCVICHGVYEAPYGGSVGRRDARKAPCGMFVARCSICGIRYGGFVIRGVCYDRFVVCRAVYGVRCSVHVWGALRVCGVCNSGFVLRYSVRVVRCAFG